MLVRDTRKRVTLPLLALPSIKIDTSPPVAVPAGACPDSVSDSKGLVGEPWPGSCARYSGCASDGRDRTLAGLSAPVVDAAAALPRAAHAVPAPLCSDALRGIHITTLVMIYSW